MAETKTYYRPGLVFKAKEKAQGHQECCRRHAGAVYTPDGAGIVRDEIPALWAEFGVYGAEFTYMDPLTEQTEIGSEFRGGYFDLDVQADEKGWGAAEREIVARHMLTLPDGRAMFTLYSKPALTAPWPTYDTAHHKQIPATAQAVGLVAEALAYEKDNKNRAEVIAKLEELLGAPAPPDEPVELAAA